MNEQGTTVTELAMIRLLLKKNPDITPAHLRTMLWLLKEKNSYFSLEEIEKSTLSKNREIKKIMKCLEKNNFLEKDGCLYKKPEKEKIAEIISVP